MVDEAAFFWMTQDEIAKVIADADVFRKKYFFRKKYSDLKEKRKMIIYCPRPVKSEMKHIENIAKRVRKTEKVTRGNSNTGGILW